MLAELSAFDAIITDDIPDVAAREALERAGLTLTIAKDEDA